MRHLTELIELAKTKPVRRLAVAAADDISVLKSIQLAFNEKIIIPILIGNKEKIIEICSQLNFNINGFEVINEPDSEISAQIAVSKVKQGKADILMKGLVGTAPLLKAILNKENGLRRNKTISHFSLFESKYYHKLFGLSDGAMIIAPTFNEKISIITNAVDIMHKLGISIPKVAILAPAETVSEKIEASVHAAMLTVMNKRKQITGCIIDGPLALDNALSVKACRHKGIDSKIAGDADILIVPELNSGNILYKSLVFMNDALAASIITGAKVPVILTSRATSEQSKFMSIALAAALE